MQFLRQSLFFALLIFSASHVLAEPVEFMFNRDKLEITKSAQEVLVTKNHSVIQRFEVTDGDANSSIIKDYDFDGYPDIAVPRDFGVERYFDVYLFNSKVGQYRKNDFLSSLACPLPNPRDKTVIASCNHASACEAWEDTYKYEDKELVLVRREGTFCDPGSGDGFKYFKIYKGNKIVRERSFPIKEK